ncbi:hypothetical protein QO021_30150 (plasmid) [Pseudomonas amygdali pv. lachrymans]|uniref:hypothetical protein n=1 Tax=Pseudomonas amygdali TaxID=47877 RepID=UPI0006B8F8D8|nr:hypothetical protein [Pseudomonas amygdali]RMM39042.1 hypothetical protein ALQ79_200046 [Pseudomonas amygdali pv. lachrymans]WIO61351.1 hypothetical protein QO021_30150 [Pseudomonas amygdali pv. lachrymans]
MPTASSHQAFNFTSFSVEPCIRVNYDNDVVYRTIHPQQETAALASVASLNCFDDLEMGLSLLSVEADGVDGVVVAAEGSEIYDIAHKADRTEISLCSGEYGGLYWRILAFVDGSTNPEDAYQMMVGDCESTVRSASAGLQGLVSLPQAIRMQSEKLDADEKAPDGDDCNDFLKLAGV